MAGDRPALSVVVMGYRNADTIVRAVGSVVAQADADVEVVVVTSGGDDTADRVRRAFPDVAVVESPQRWLPGATRNRGVAATSGAVVAFLEGDCVAEPGWVAGRLRRHAEGWEVVASAVTNGDRRHLAAWGFHFGIYWGRLAGRRAGRVSGGSPSAHGLSCTRDALARVGPFDETVPLGEDTDAARALEAAGVAIWFEPSVRVAHGGPTSLAALVRDRYRRGLLRGATRGPVATSWSGVARQWAQSFARLPAMWRDAGGDRGWLLVCLPWWAAGDAAMLVGNQRGASTR